MPRWRNWETHQFEGLAGQPVEVQVLFWAVLLVAWNLAAPRFRATGVVVLAARVDAAIFAAALLS